MHAVDEKARAYYNFEGLWTSDKSNAEQIQVYYNLILLAEELAQLSFL